MAVRREVDVYFGEGYFLYGATTTTPARFVYMSGTHELPMERGALREAWDQGASVRDENWPDRRWGLWARDGRWFRQCRAFDFLDYVKINSFSAEWPFSLRRNKGRDFWLFETEVWSSPASDELTPDQMRSFVLAHRLRKQKRVKNAEAIVETRTIGKTPRDAIPDDVKVAVWQRDGGTCVTCGSKENLEFDHVIPIVMGGSNTARNLQILCERCNRAKGGNLV